MKISSENTRASKYAVTVVNATIKIGDFGVIFLISGEAIKTRWMCLPVCLRAKLACL